MVSTNLHTISVSTIVFLFWTLQENVSCFSLSSGLKQIHPSPRTCLWNSLLDPSSFSTITSFNETILSSTATMSPTSTTTISTLSSSSSSSASPPADPQEVVKLFGRLAEKYIMLDPSGGMCCYSACTDCEYRLPDGGYRMAEQSSSRPKWIVAYDHRSFPSSGKEHVSKWCIDLFINDIPVITKEEFVLRLSQAKYNPPLGGPFISASAAQTIDEPLAHRLFDILAQGKDKITKHKMGVRIKQLAHGEEGLTWNEFLLALSL